MDKYLQNEALTGLMNTIVDGVITIDEMGVIQDFNLACEKLFGYEAAEIVGQNVKELMPDPYREGHDGYLDNYKTTGRREIIGIGREVIGRRKDGTTFPMELSVGEINEGEKRAFVGVIRDITDRVRLEQGLRDSEAQHRAVIDTAVDGIIIIDSLGTVRMYNPACEAMFGYAADTVIGNNVKMLMPSPYYDEHDRYLQNYSQTGERKIIGVGREVIGRRKDGTTFPMELSVGETQMAGNQYFVGVLRDITQSKLAEEALRRSEAELKDRITEVAKLAEETSKAREAAEEANQVKSAFLASMSHELRTPLNAMMGMIQVLEMQGLAPEQKESFDIIKVSSQSLLELLNDILDLSKIEAGKLTLEIQTVSIGELLELARGLWQSQAQSKGLEFEIVNACGDIDLVRTDGLRLKQVLFNLLSNAFKFTESGKVEVKAAAMKADGLKDSVEVRFEVKDTGIGLTAEQQRALFQPFSQADSSTTRKFGGTGLGLHISHEIAGLLGGEIGIDSEFGNGSVFWFTIVAERGAADDTAESCSHASGSVQQALPPLPDGLRILVAEDNHLNQQVILGMLNGSGAHVELAENGSQVLEKVTTGDYDIILMDAHMPDLDGIGATKKIRSMNGKMANIPIIAVTASSMDSEQENFRNSGMDDFVAKPIDFQLLITKINTLIRRKEKAPVQRVS